MKINLKQYLLYTSVFAIFSEVFFFNFIIDVKLLYLIVISNYFLLSRIKKLQINIYFVLILLLIFIQSFISNTIIGVPYKIMLAQLVGMSIVGIYYYNLLSIYKPIDVINVYIKMSFWVAVIGYPLFLFGLQIGNVGEERFCSFFKEPAHYVIVVLPACYYYFYNKQYFRFAVIFASLILSSSSLGYIGCGLLFLLPNLTLKRVGYFTLILPVLATIFYLTYKNYPLFAMRVDDTYSSVNAINNGKFKEETNLSSYALMSNLFVAKSNFVDHPIGSGIGSHPYMHKTKYYAQMRAPKYLITQDLQDTNASDANSMFTRMMSEMGITGLLLIISLVFLAYKNAFGNNIIFAQAVVVYVFLKIFRDGHYFAPEFYFFIWLLYFCIKEYQQSQKDKLIQ